MNPFRGSPCAPAAVVGLLFLLSVSTVARADKMISTPAEKYAVNPGGVDMRTGQYTYRQTDLDVGGSDESGGLLLTRMTRAPWHAANPFGNFTHNWVIMITEKRVDLYNSKFEDGSGQDFQVGVRFGGRSQVFNSYLSDTGFTQASKGAFAQLSFTGDRTSASIAYTFTAADGTVALFRPLGNFDCLANGASRCAYVSQIVEPDGTTFTFNYDYNSSPPAGVERARLRNVVSSRGYALLLEGSNNLITKACVLNLTLSVVPASNLCPANALATATYVYNGSRLATVTDPSGATSTFTYGAGPNGWTAMGFVKPGQSTAWLTNNLGPAMDEDNGNYDAVMSQSFADGQSYTYVYDYTPFVDNHTPNQTIAGGQYTDALNHTTQVRYEFPIMPGALACHGFACPTRTFGESIYQLTSGPVTIIDPLNRTSTSSYCDPQELTVPPPQGGCLVTLVQNFTDPEGIKTELSYDGSRNIIQVRRHAKPGTGLPDIVTSAIYDTSHPKSANKPLSTTDANGNVASYTYAPEHGGLLTETGPAVNGVRSQKRYTYAQRYAWISNGAGGYVQAATPVWLLTQMSFCKSGNPNSTNSGCANGPSDEVITTYDYGPDSGPNNLILRGTVVDAGGLSLRSCTSYDALGNKISETKPRAGLASCP